MAEVNLISASNPRWGDAAKTFVIVDCEFREYPYLGVHGYMASDNDPEAHGRMIYHLAVSEKFGPIADFVPPEI